MWPELEVKKEEKCGNNELSLLVTEVSSFPLQSKVGNYCYPQRFDTPVTVAGGRTLWILYAYSSSIFPGFTYLTRDSSEFRFLVTFLCPQLVVNCILLTLLTKEVTVVFSLEENVRTYTPVAQPSEAFTHRFHFLSWTKKKKKKKGVAKS